MLRMNFISLPVTNSADGGRRSYILSCPNAIKPLVSAPYPAGGKRLRPLESQPPVGNAAPSSGCPLAPPLVRVSPPSASDVNSLTTRDVICACMTVVDRVRHVTTAYDGSK